MGESSAVGCSSSHSNALHDARPIIIYGAVHGREHDVIETSISQETFINFQAMTVSIALHLAVAAAVWKFVACKHEEVVQLSFLCPAFHFAFHNSIVEVQSQNFILSRLFG